jgi:flap endonuclease-1
VGRGEADAVVTDDYDALVYLCTLASGKGRMVIGLNRPNIVEYDVKDMLREIQLEPLQFVDVCILSGCDFCNKIGGVACNRAFQLVTEHKNIETILENLDDKFVVPGVFDYPAARDQFGCNN